MPSLPPLNWDAIRQVLGLLLMLAGVVGVQVGLWHINPWAVLVTAAAIFAVGGYLLATVRTEET